MLFLHCLLDCSNEVPQHHNFPTVGFICRPQIAPLRVLQQRIKAGLQLPTSFATVVTDLTTCHNTWFSPKVTRCYVATDISRQQAIKMGLKVAEQRGQTSAQTMPWGTRTHVNVSPAGQKYG